MPKTGRPRALDESKRREVCALISTGCGMEGAARYVGCAASTIRREAIRNREFNDQLRRAGLTAELMPLNALRKAASKHWRAAAWLLERMNAQRFARQNVRHLKPEQVQHFIDLLGEALLGETKDHDAYRRVLRRMEKIITHMDQEVHAAEFDPFPKPRRPRKTSSALSPVGGVSDADALTDPQHAIGLREASHNRESSHNPIATPFGKCET